jgi:hypothetical protein
MKTFEELSAEHADDPGVDAINAEMMAALRAGQARISPQLAQQAQLNWHMMLLEYIVRQVTPEELQDEAIEGFREFAQHSHLVNMYNALVASSEKKLVVPK